MSSVSATSSWPRSRRSSAPRLALDVLHDDEVAAAGRVEAGVEDLDDVRVHELRRRQRLALEARHERRVVGEVLGEQLDRDVALQARVHRQVDGRHAAEPEAPLEPVAPGDLRPPSWRRHPSAVPPAPPCRRRGRAAGAAGGRRAAPRSSAWSAWSVGVVVRRGRVRRRRRRRRRSCVVGVVSVGVGRRRRAWWSVGTVSRRRRPGRAAVRRALREVLDPLLQPRGAAPRRRGWAAVDLLLEIGRLARQRRRTRPARPRIRSGRAAAAIAAASFEPIRPLPSPPQATRIARRPRRGRGRAGSSGPRRILTDRSRGARRASQAGARRGSPPAAPPMS